MVSGPILRPTAGQNEVSKMPTPSNSGGTRPALRRPSGDIVTHHILHGPKQVFLLAEAIGPDLIFAVFNSQHGLHLHGQACQRHETPIFFPRHRCLNSGTAKKAETYASIRLTWVAMASRTKPYRALRAASITGRRYPCSTAGSRGLQFDSHGFL